MTHDDVLAYEAELRRELPRFRVCYKDESRLQRFIGRLLRPFNRDYMTLYTTVMFGRVYFPSRRWRARLDPREVYCTLRHEAVHLRDARRFPLFFQLSYLFLLPAVFTLRAFWEWRGYLETLRAEAEVYGEVSDERLDTITQRFVGADYLFMFPFKRFVRGRLERRRDEALAQVSPARKRR